MKNLILLALCATTLVACQKELSLEPNSNPPINPLPTPPPGTSNNCFSCEYFPFCDGSQFAYVDSLIGTTTLDTLIYDILADTTIANVPHKKLTIVGSGQTAYYTCNNSVLQFFAYAATGTGGTTVNNIVQTQLKANEPIGTKWKDVLNNNGSLVEFRYELIAKNQTRQVFDSTYRDIIYVRDTTLAVVPLIGEIPSSVRHAYYAKGIGLVEVNIDDIFTGLPVLKRKLKFYRR